MDKELKGKVFIEAFSQEKDELVLIFADMADQDELVSPFFIKATMRPGFACLSFPDSFQRARRNSVNLFTLLYNKAVVHVRVFLNERALGFWLEGGEVLVFKLFGNRSNIIAFDTTESVLEVFNHKLTPDQSLDLSALDRSIDQSFGAFLQHDLKYEKLFPTFGKLVNEHITNLLVGVDGAEKQWAVIQSVLSELSMQQFFLTQIDSVPVLSLLPAGIITAQYINPVEALNAFYYAYIRLTGIEKERAEMAGILRKRIRQTESYLENTLSKLIGLEEGSRNDEIANILMANLHLVPARSESIELFDFYHDRPVKIKLKKDLSPQKNAEVFYRKSKNEKIELAKLHESLDIREKEKLTMLQQLEDIQKIEILRELRSYIKANGLAGGSNSIQVAADLFKKVEFQGYTIFIGRNAKNNDLLTKQYAFKEDLWLHARDVSGSHVVVKYQPGRKFPSTVIEKAAELAAFYSKRKTDSLCPVIVTPKKYVRKLKGMAEGAVIVDKEDVVMVVPKGE